MNLQHYIFGRRTPEFTAPHLLVAEHLILKFRHLFGCGTPDFKDKFEV